VAANNYYRDLGLGEGPAPLLAVQRAYRRALKAAHPDGGGSAPQLRRVRAAFAVLGDAATKADYDDFLDNRAGPSLAEGDATYPATMPSPSAPPPIKDWAWRN
jgi:DnaJ-class molecular chaperone